MSTCWVNRSLSIVVKLQREKAVDDVQLYASNIGLDARHHCLALWSFTYSSHIFTSWLQRKIPLPWLRLCSLLRRSRSWQGPYKMLRTKQTHTLHVDHANACRRVSNSRQVNHNNLSALHATCRCVSPVQSSIPHRLARRFRCLMCCFFTATGLQGSP